MSEQVQENKMGIMPVGKLLMSMSIPMMISMLVQALYNVVDSYFVAQISQDALNAVGLAFPYQLVQAWGSTPSSPAAWEKKIMKRPTLRRVTAFCWHF